MPRGFNWAGWDFVDWIIAQPRVLEDFIDAGVSHAKVGLSLQESIDKICRLQRPIIGNLVLLDLDLLSQHFFSDFFTRTAMKRTSSQHQLVRDDSDSKIISWIRVILPAKDLRRHVARRSTSISTIISPKRPCNTKISQPCKPLTIQHYILRLDITMDNAFRMQVLQAQCNANYYKLCLLLVEPFSGEVMPKVASGQEV